MAEPQYFSPAEVSRALGVSVTTIKRWVDDGVLPAHKTAGGHRKILRADVLRLVREGNFPRLDLRRLDSSAPAGRPPDTERLSGRLLDGLRRGDEAAVRAVVHGGYEAGLPVEVLADRVVAPAMHTVGHQWQEGRLDVFHEHRGSELCAGVLHELKARLEANAAVARPAAVGGSPEGDHSALASLLAQLVLIDAGWDAVNVGPHTPLASFRKALHEVRPRLMWLSVSHLPDDTERFLDEYAALYRDAERAGVPVAVGGRALDACVRARMAYTFHGDGLSHLAAFARTLHPRPRPPKRGRPHKGP
jgi:excisionase family DNA binding protein